MHSIHGDSTEVRRLLVTRPRRRLKIIPVGAQNGCDCPQTCPIHTPVVCPLVHNANLLLIGNVSSPIRAQPTCRSRGVSCASGGQLGVVSSLGGNLPAGHPVFLPL